MKYCTRVTHGLVFVFSKQIRSSCKNEYRIDTQKGAICFTWPLKKQLPVFGITHFRRIYDDIKVKGFRKI